ncbi:MAG TPA: pitrilysin family protein [bacterium]|nr:pitrilysin family protein [bacterium]HPR86852.1 pitrilysin family protein [bacterium]
MPSRRQSLTLLLLFTAAAAATPLRLPCERYQLGNGLEVILHQDHSDPVVAVALQYHVGSNREVAGRTGFAHLFEHMMFQESEHVGQDQFFKKIQGAGGELNGGTNADGTVYFETVPRNALEMVLWLESDRMGWLLSTVTAAALANQQGVVQNEKRQNYDNRPYGQTSYIIGKLLYPAGHPYSREVIGEMADLRNATLADVHDFYKHWYGPGNATLVVAGDFEPSQTRTWIETYFAEIPARPEVQPLPPMAVRLESSHRAKYEDGFIRSPELTMVFPTVQRLTREGHALDFLAELLAGNKKSPLYQVLVEEEKLAPSVRAWQSSQEIAGTFSIRVRAFPEVELGRVEAAIQRALARFEARGFTARDLERCKAGLTTSWYTRISSVLGKSMQLAWYNEYAGSPDYMATDLEQAQSITAAEIWQVYTTYIKTRPFVLTSFVPKGRSDLAAPASLPFTIPEDPGAAAAAASLPVAIPQDPAASASATTAAAAKPADSPAPSRFDRALEPAPGPEPSLHALPVWRQQLDNGMTLSGITQRELPLLQAALTLKGGALLDAAGKEGTASLLARLMMEGTRTKTPVELEEAIADLGATISVAASAEAITISATSLSARWPAVMALMAEILLEPRWDEKELARLRQEAAENIQRSQSNPATVANQVINRLLYGESHPLSRPVEGTAASVHALSLSDLQAYYRDHVSPWQAHLAIAGDIDAHQVDKTLRTLEKRWKGEESEPPLPPAPAPGQQARLYFIDFPGAKQSEVRVGHLALSARDADYFPATVMNYRLGGSFNGLLNLILREEKGFTYGARSRFSGGMGPGTFMVTTSVQSGATLETLRIIREEIQRYRQGIPDEDLRFSKSAQLKAHARSYETLRAQVGLLEQMALYHLPGDCIEQQEAFLRSLSNFRHTALAQKYLHPEQLIYLVVGDANSQLASLRELGLGEPVRLDKEGQPIR